MSIRERLKFERMKRAVSFKGRKIVCNVDQTVMEDMEAVIAHVSQMHRSWPMEGMGDKLRWWDTSKPCTTRPGCIRGSGHPPSHDIQGTGHTGGQSCEKCGGGLCELHQAV